MNFLVWTVHYFLMGFVARSQELAPDFLDSSFYLIITISYWSGFKKTLRFFLLLISETYVFETLFYTLLSTFELSTEKLTSDSSITYSISTILIWVVT